MSLIEKCEILSVSNPRAGAVDMVLKSEMARTALPGQFVHIKCREDTLLRRPISICDAWDDRLRLAIEDVGAGTKWLTQRRRGDMLDLLGPLGDRGFDMPQDTERPVLLIGGGVGVAPLLFAAKKLSVNSLSFDAVLGFKSSGMVILEDDFTAACRTVTVCTDDGSCGRAGFVTGPAAELIAQNDYQCIYACGNTAMLRAVAKLGAKSKIKTLVSLDERMGCGLGACLVCACKQADGRYLHVCKDGPVFDAKEVAW